MNKRHFRVLAASILAAVVVCSCSGLKKFSNPAIAADQTAALQSQWDSAFAQKSGWTGGDVAASFVIPGNRVLWVFGDSWVGDVEGGRHVRATLVNNAIAIHPYDPDRPGKAPAPEKVSFYWGPADDSGKPSAWVMPVDPERSNPGGLKTWYWPTGGGVVLPGPEGGQRLALFLIRLEKKPGPGSLWAFQCIGSAVAIIDNVEEPAPVWKPRVIQLPHRMERNPKDGPVSSQVDWGVASLYQPGFDGAPGHVFIYGVESDQSNNRDLLLARVSPEKFGDFGEWEFFAGDGQWLKSPGRASRIVRGVAGELSVDKISGKNAGVHFVMVYSEPLFGDRIFARTARNPEGPWSELKPVFTVPEVKKSKNYFSYAAKGHARLSGPGALLISYIVNSHEFNELVNDASIYRPRFIIVQLDELGIR